MNIKEMVHVFRPIYLPIVNSNMWAVFKNRYWMDDEKYLKYLFKKRLGYELNLDNPKTFNEKLQWIKLHDRKPIYTIMVDKVKAKEYVASIIGEEYIIPNLGIWDRAEDIDFDSLPDKFVLKCNHNSGEGMYICKDKSNLDRRNVVKKIAKGLKVQYYYNSREWPYKNVPHKVLAEKFMEDSTKNGLLDYKFFCFNGVPKFMYISNDAGDDPRTDFFDMDFKHLNMRMKDPSSDILPEKPVCFEEMKVLAEKLSKGIPFVRADFYFVNNHIYFGEMTFFHNGGFTHTYPIEWEEIMGNWISLPERTN